MSLAETISWVAWGIAVTEADFAAALCDCEDDVYEGMRAHGREVCARILAQAGCPYPSDDARQSLEEAFTKLRNKCVAGNLTAYAKQDRSPGERQPVPAWWLEDARGLTFDLVMGWLRQHEREACLPNYYLDIVFERAKVEALFPKKRPRGRPGDKSETQDKWEARADEVKARPDGMTIRTKCQEIAQRDGFSVSTVEREVRRVVGQRGEKVSR